MTRVYIVKREYGLSGICFDEKNISTFHISLTQGFIIGDNLKKRAEKITHVNGGISFKRLYKLSLCSFDELKPFSIVVEAQRKDNLNEFYNEVIKKVNKYLDENNLLEYNF